MNFVLKMMNSLLKMMNSVQCELHAGVDRAAGFHLKSMNFVFKMMDSALKMMKLLQPRAGNGMACTF